MDVIDMVPEEEQVEEALGQAIAWTLMAADHFDKSTVDHVALCKVVDTLDAVLVGYRQANELRDMGITPTDRTYNPGFTIV